MRPPKLKNLGVECANQDGNHHNQHRNGPKEGGQEHRPLPGLLLMAFHLPAGVAEVEPGELHDDVAAHQHMGHGVEIEAQKHIQGRRDPIAQNRALQVRQSGAAEHVHRAGLGHPLAQAGENHARKLIGEQVGSHQNGGGIGQNRQKPLQIVVSVFPDDFYGLPVGVQGAQAVDDHGVDGEHGAEGDDHQHRDHRRIQAGVHPTVRNGSGDEVGDVEGVCQADGEADAEQRHRQRNKENNQHTGGGDKALERSEALFQLLEDVGVFAQQGILT